LTTCTTKHFLELFEYISKRVLSTCTGTLPASLPKLIVEPFEAREALSTSAKRTACLLLFIGIHASLIIHFTLAFIAQSLIGLIDSSKLLFGTGVFINVWMVLLG
jgi:hypothetical protein